jgi:hypothetical protein
MERVRQAGYKIAIVEELEEKIIENDKKERVRRNE